MRDSCEANKNEATVLLVISPFCLFYVCTTVLKYSEHLKEQADI